jgi:hypothetical protein
MELELVFRIQILQSQVLMWLVELQILVQALGNRMLVVLMGHRRENSLLGLCQVYRTENLLMFVQTLKLLIRFNPS